MSPRAGVDRGVSEVLGFVLTFSLILLSVSLVYVGGSTAIGNVRQAQQTNSAAASMTSLAESWSHLENGDPARAGELSLAGGTLSVVNTSTLTVTVTHGGSASIYEFHPRSLVYESGKTRIRYMGGGVVRVRDAGSIMVRRPSFVCADDVAVVSVVTIDSTGSGGVGGGGSTVVMARNTGTALLFPTTASTAGSATSVTVSVDAPGEAAWGRYFNQSTGWTHTASGYRCSAPRAFVRRTNVSVDLQT